MLMMMPPSKNYNSGLLDAKQMYIDKSNGNGKEFVCVSVPEYKRPAQSWVNKKNIVLPGEPANRLDYTIKT